MKNLLKLVTGSVLLLGFHLFKLALPLSDLQPRTVDLLPEVALL